MLCIGPEPSLFDRAKTKKKTIEITTDAHGKPEIPSVTPKDDFYAKDFQDAIRKYCTDHIRESTNPLHVQHNISMRQVISPDGRVHVSCGPS